MASWGNRAQPRGISSACFSPLRSIFFFPHCLKVFLLHNPFSPTARAELGKIFPSAKWRRMHFLKPTLHCPPYLLHLSASLIYLSVCFNFPFSLLLLSSHLLLLPCIFAGSHSPFLSKWLKVPLPNCLIHGSCLDWLGEWLILHAGTYTLAYSLVEINKVWLL